MNELDHRARLALAPGHGVSYQYDSEGGVMVVTFDGTNPRLILATMETWIKEVSGALVKYREKWRDFLPAQEPGLTPIEVDEEIAHFLKLKEKEGVSPNAALRFLIFGENPYDDPEKRRTMEQQIEDSSKVRLAEPDSLRAARDKLGES